MCWDTIWLGIEHALFISVSSYAHVHILNLLLLEILECHKFETYHKTSESLLHIRRHDWNPQIFNLFESFIHICRECKSFSVLNPTSHLFFFWLCCQTLSSPPAFMLLLCLVDVYTSLSVTSVDCISISQSLFIGAWTTCQWLHH